MTIRAFVLATPLLAGLPMSTSAQALQACRLTTSQTGPTTTITMHVPTSGYALSSCAISLPGPFPSATVSQAALKGLAIGEVQALRLSPGHGTVETFDGTIRYTPELGFNGVDRFAVDLESAAPGSPVATVSTLNFLVTAD